MSTSAEDYNAKLIVEFRANDGRVGGVWEGTPLLLLHHTGAKSGASRVNPVGYLPDPPRYLIFASNGGATSNPDWYHNLKAQPNTSIEVGPETIDVLAEEAMGEERKRLFARGADRFPDLAKYARTADRVIPVIVLTPLGGDRATVDAADERASSRRREPAMSTRSAASLHATGPGSSATASSCSDALIMPTTPYARVCCVAGATSIASRPQRPRGSGSTGSRPTSASKISTGPMSLAAGNR